MDAFTYLTNMCCIPRFVASNVLGIVANVLAVGGGGKMGATKWGLLSQNGSPLLACPPARPTTASETI